jgi:hypothetical protein
VTSAGDREVEQFRHLLLAQTWEAPSAEGLGLVGGFATWVVTTVYRRSRRSSREIRWPVMRATSRPSLAMSPVWVVVACCALSLALPSTTVASRPPHPNQRTAITRAAIATDGGPLLLVRVTGIRISIAGPWATAIVTIFQRKFPRHPEMSAVESFYSDDGRWLDTNNANTPERNPPSAVQADLGLQPNSTKGGNGLSTAAIIGIVLGALVLVSIIASQGGGSSGSEAFRSHALPTPARANVQTSGEQKQKRPCTSCGTTGKLLCTHYKCQKHGGWWEPDPHNPGRQQWQICVSCGGSTYSSVCGNCKGDGWIS